MDRPSLQDSTVGKQQLTDEVFPAELQEIRRRRNNVLHGATEHLQEKAGPHTDLRLVGLAFSGGGIRSATFCLGAAQAMAKYGVLRLADYLSTVSGGGFIGGCFSSVLNSPQTGVDGREFPFCHEPGVEEPMPFRVLRNNSTYLATEGFLDYWRIPALLLRGIVLNLLALVPYILLAVFITDSLYGSYFRRLAAGQIAGSWGDLMRLTPIAVIAFFSWVVLYLILLRLFQPKLEKNLRLRDRFERTYALGLVVVFAALAVDLVPVAFRYYISSIHFDGKALWSLMTSIAGIIPYLFAHRAARNISRWYGRAGLYVLGLFGPVILLSLYLFFADLLICRNPQELFMPPKYFYLAGILIFAYTRFFMDVNATSVHSFYRDRLAHAFLFRYDPAGDGIEPNYGQRLTTLKTKSSKAPYHLINATLNLQGSDDPNLRGRNADFFLFSKHFTGSYQTGYCATKVLETLDPHLNLATAMAISGAAVSPNSGATTIKPLVFLLTLLNLRLGYWLANPGLVREKGKLLLRRVKFEYLLKELFGRVDARSRFVNVTDGGHLENLGVYELLRRRCKVIISVDAGADPHHDFSALAQLIRMARIDMAIEIDIDLDALCKHSDQMCERHWAIGRIDYGGGQTGYLIYLKASMTGDEEEYVREYWLNHPDFPHETTADQFFDEAQFEVYRALGYHVARELFHDGEARELIEGLILEGADVDLVEELHAESQRPRPGFQPHPE